MVENDAVMRRQSPYARTDQGAGGPAAEGGHDGGSMHANGNRIIYIGHNQIDGYAIDAVSILNRDGGVTLRSKGRSIPIAVTVANIVTREILTGSSRVKQILLDTDAEPGIGSMTSTIEIHLGRS